MRFSLHYSLSMEKSFFNMKTATWTLLLLRISLKRGRGKEYKCSASTYALTNLQDREYIILISRKFLLSSIECNLTRNLEISNLFLLSSIIRHSHSKRQLNIRILKVYYVFRPNADTNRLHMT